MVCAGAMALYQCKEGGKEEVIPELGNCSFGILPSEFTSTPCLKNFCLFNLL